MELFSQLAGWTHQQQTADDLEVIEEEIPFDEKAKIINRKLREIVIDRKINETDLS